MLQSAIPLLLLPSATLVLGTPVVLTSASRRQPPPYQPTSSTFSTLFCNFVYKWKGRELRLCTLVCLQTLFCPWTSWKAMCFSYRGTPCHLKMELTDTILQMLDMYVEFRIRLRGSSFTLRKRFGWINKILDGLTKEFTYYTDNKMFDWSNKICGWLNQIV